MNRKLHHSLMALMATTGVFGALLLAAGPLASSGPASSPAMLDALPTMTATLDAIVPVATSQRHQRHSRALLAMPYFSFAQGLRRNRI